MSTPDLVPRSPFLGLAVVWGASALIAIAIGIFAPESNRALWLCAGLGGCLIIAFAVQIAYARSEGFITRISASVVGALMIMGLVSVVFGIASLLA